MALFTPWMSCAMSTSPCAFVNARQALGGWWPRTMLTPRTNSLIATVLLPSQSPTQALTWSMANTPPLPAA